MLKCAQRGSALTPAIVPEASIPPSPVAPTGQDDGSNFSVGFIARRCVGRGRGLSPHGTSLEAGVLGGFPGLGAQTFCSDSTDDSLKQLAQ